MRYSVCTDSVFGGKDTAESIKKCADAGFDAVEFWSWKNKDMEKIIEASKRHNVEIAVFCASECNLVDASLRGAFLDGLGQSVEAAKKAGTRKLIAVTGNDTGEPREAQRESIVAGLKEAAPMLEASGVELLLEPLNTLYERPGYFLDHSAEGFEIVREVGSPNVTLLFDIYHLQYMEGNIINNIRGGIDLIGHFHTAGVPGRTELDKGELDYRFILGEIRKLNYEGFIGMEYIPTEPPEKWLAAWRRV